MGDQLRPVITGGVAIVVGLIMVIIGLYMIPELVTTSTSIRGTANFSDYIALDPMAKIVPTIAMIGLTFGGTLIGIMGGKSIYRSQKG